MNDWWIGEWEVGRRVMGDYRVDERVVVVWGIRDGSTSDSESGCQNKQESECLSFTGTNILNIRICNIPIEILKSCGSNNNSSCRCLQATKTQLYLLRMY